ncbi:hypothetical protein AgCh_001296 [Apium graveolens]
MESFGSILEGDWSSLYAQFSTEESEFMEHLIIDYCSVPNDLHFDSSFTIPSDNSNIDPCDNTCFYPSLNHNSYYAGDFDHILATNDNSIFWNEEAKDKNPTSVEILSFADIHEDVQKNKRSVKAKKNQKIEMTSCTKNKEKNAAVQTRGSSSCSSDNDPIATDEQIGVASNSSDSKEVTNFSSNGEMRVVRGSATDPQSLYARKRRERINEKLRTLQNLVPNGTKVDISTMLEDAVQYVKFLQLQIKLLSSDKWMYAPIAYNGTDLRLDSNISPPLY